MNLAVIAGNEDTDEWAIKTMKHRERVAIFGDPVGANEMWEYISYIEEMITDWTDRRVKPPTFTAKGVEVRPLTEAWLQDLHESYYRAMNQHGPPTPMIAESIEEALEEGFQWAVRDEPMDD